MKILNNAGHFPCIVASPMLHMQLQGRTHLDCMQLVDNYRLVDHIPPRVQQLRACFATTLAVLGIQYNGKAVRVYPSVN